MTSESGTDKPTSLASHFLGSRFLILTILTVAQALLMVANTWATTIERYSLRLSGDVSELQFQMQGAVPRWRLHSRGQELRLDLERSQVDGSLEPVSIPVASPLTRISIRDFGGGRVRLAIRVRGRVDYVVAQMPQRLIVRIAPAGRKVDLAAPLLREMELNRPLSATRVSSTAMFKAPRLERRTTVVESAHRLSSETVGTVNQAVATESAIAGSGWGSSPSLSPGYTSSPASNSEALAQTVQPVAQRVRPVPWVRPGARPLVVIDPGHGGLDPGTGSVGGITEKTVALAIARRLATALEARAIGTELTRDDDRYLSLGDRTELANLVHANLFVSIHLNSSPDLNASGIETYYLNNTTDRATIRLARIENGTEDGTFGQSNLNYILTNLQQDYKAHESSSLARMIETEVATSVEASLGTRVKALGAKMGPFYVLVGAEMPSVLIECGFLSSPRETQLLMQPGYQASLADGIAAAIKHYFNPDAAVGNL